MKLTNSQQIFTFKLLKGIVNANIFFTSNVMTNCIYFKIIKIVVFEIIKVIVR